MDGGSRDPVTLLLRGILALGRRLRVARPRGSVSLSGLSILGSLNRLGPLVATRLASEERLQPQSLTRLLADLEKDHLISRRRSHRDRREITIAIAAKGRKVLLQDIAVRRRWLETAMAASLSRDDRETLFAASAIMIRLAAYQDEST
jgi:DNA-binding MarR family transcriptional regulator